MNKYIALDLGTTTIKAALFDECGRLLDIRRHETTLTFTDDGKTLCSPEFWYELPCRLIKDIVEANGADDIAALSISSQGISIIPVGEDGRPLGLGISWLSAANDECDRVFKVCPDITEITGKPKNPLYSLPKLISMKEHESARFEAAKYFLMPMDYLIFRMTDIAVTEHSMAGGTMLYSNAERGYSRELCEKFGIPYEKLPRVGVCGEAVGTLNAETVRLTGLRRDTIVALGAQDQKIAAMAAGLTNTRPTLSLGTSCAIELAGKVKGFPHFIHSDGETPISEGCINTACGAIKWLSTLFGISYDELDELADGASSMGVIFRPNLSGEGTPHTGELKNASIENLTLGVGKANICRALLEGIACEIRMNLDTSGGKFDGLRAFGGGTKSALLCNIIADITRLPLEVTEIYETALFGAASAASKAHRGVPLALPTDSIKLYEPRVPSSAEEIYGNYIKLNNGGLDHE